jgi:hypothetical protein
MLPFVVPGNALMNHTCDVHNFIPDFVYLSFHPLRTRVLSVVDKLVTSILKVSFASRARSTSEEQNDVGQTLGFSCGASLCPTICIQNVSIRWLFTV